MGSGDTFLGVTLHVYPGGVAILSVPSCYRNQDKLARVGLLGSCAATLPLLHTVKPPCMSKSQIQVIA